MLESGDVMKILGFTPEHVVWNFSSAFISGLAEQISSFFLYTTMPWGKFGPNVTKPVNPNVSKAAIDTNKKDRKMHENVMKPVNLIYVSKTATDINKKDKEDAWLIIITAQWLIQRLKAKLTAMVWLVT